MSNIKLSSLLPAVIVNFFYYGTIGGVISYLAVLLTSRDFSSTEIGALIALYTFIRMFTGQLWAYFADKHQNPKLYFQLAILISLVAMLPSLWFEPKWVTFVSLVSSFVFFMAAVSQIEVLSLAATRDDPVLYNRVRLFGSIGFIIAAIVVGTLVQWYGEETILIFGLVSIAVAFITSFQLDNGEQYAAEEGSDTAGFVRRCLTLGFIIFMLASILLQMSFAPYVGFFTQYLAQNHYSGTATGILFALGTFSEIFMFLVAGTLLSRFSLKALMATCLLLTSLRWGLVAVYVDVAWLVIVTQFIHALSFGLMHSSSIHYVRHYFPKHLQNQGQFMYLGITFGVGGSVGAWLTGVTWLEGTGATQTFLWASAVVFVAGLLILMTPRKNFQFSTD